MCYHVLPCIAMYRHVLPCTAMYLHVLPCTAMYSNVLPCNTMYYHVLPCITVVSKTKTEARSTQNSKTKHPRSKTKTPKSRKRSTQISKTKTPKLDNEAPESGGGSGCIRTSKGPQNQSQGFIRACQLFNWTFLDSICRIYCINFIIGLTVLDTSYLNMHFFGTHTCLCRLQNCPSPDFGVFKYAWAVNKSSETRLKTECEARAYYSYATLYRLLYWFWEKNRLFCSLTYWICSRLRPFPIAKLCLVQ